MGCTRFFSPAGFSMQKRDTKKGPRRQEAGRAGVIDPDGGKAARRDAQRQRSSVITAPGRQQAVSRDFLDQSIGQELADRLFGEAALRALPRVNGAVLALRGGGQQHKRRKVCSVT